MNITKRIKQFFQQDRIEDVAPRQDRSVQIDWAKRDAVMLDRNKSRTFGF